MANQSKAEKIAHQRVNEQYLLAQVNYHYQSETFRDHKDRTLAGDRLYRGALNELFPSEQNVPDIPYVENKFKNALHDITRLASEGRGAVKFIPEGDKDRDMKRARVRESINEGYWVVNKMKARERQSYLDLAGAGMVATAVYYNANSRYPQVNRLNPRFVYPDVRDGKLQSLVVIEQVKERILARQFPHLGLKDDAASEHVAVFTCYYDEYEVVEAVIVEENDKLKDARIVKRWEHGLGLVPVAFEMLDTYDGAFHGLFEQLAGPLMVRNKTVRFLVDYLESMAHAPIRSKNVLNPDDEPGPLTIYQIDPNADDWVFDRLPPAAPANSVFGLLSYMQDQEEKEAIQPPARSGNVSQSIASGSFVDRTQGQLTSVTKELQDKMASVREQVNEICMRVEEKWMDFSKPLIRPVSGKNEYTPSEDIKGWYHHEVKFGAGAGLDRLNADSRVQNHLAARLISREEARAEIDYLDDSASSQDKIDRENLADALLQRFVRDPATPASLIARTWLEMKMRGKSLEEALEVVVPDMVAAEQAAQPQQPPGIPGAEPVAEGQPAAGPEPPEVRLPYPSVQQLFGPGR